jgi:hypothetical protein
MIQKEIQGAFGGEVWIGQNEALVAISEYHKAENLHQATAIPTDSATAWIPPFRQLSSLKSSHDHRAGYCPRLYPSGLEPCTK